MAYQVTLEEAATHLPELVREARSGQDIVFTEGRFPVARLVGFDEDAVSTSDLANLAMTGGAFDWLADEPDLYDDACGEAIHQ